MSEKTVDALILAARFDDTELARSGRAIVLEAQKTSVAAAAAFRTAGVSERDMGPPGLQPRTSRAEPLRRKNLAWRALLSFAA